jgi:hypothetical protein
MSRPFLIPKIIMMLMIDRQLRISDLARICDTSDRNIYYLLQGKRKKPKYHDRISRALEISEPVFSKIISDFKETRESSQKGSRANEHSEI